MNCMRCGKKTEGKAVFCPECLEEMAQYPVKPGTVVQIPHRQESEVRKTIKKKRELSMEEQLHNALEWVQIFFVSTMGLLCALIISVLLLFFVISQTDAPPQEVQPPVGRNYTIITPDHP